VFTALPKRKKKAAFFSWEEEKRKSGRPCFHVAGEKKEYSKTIKKHTHRKRYLCCCRKK